MSQKTGKDLFKVFQELNIFTGDINVQSLDWLFCNEETLDVLEWFCSYINSNNTLTLEEERAYNILKEKNGVLEGEELEDAINEAALAYPGIFDVDNEDILSLEEYLSDERKHLAGIEQLTDFCVQNDSKLNHELLELYEENGTLSNELQSLTKKSAELSSKLSNAQQQFHFVINDILMVYRLYSDKDETTTFMSKMPLHIFFRECSLFDSYLRKYIKKQFENCFNGNSTHKTNLSNNLKQLKQGIVDAIIERTSAKCELDMVLAMLKASEQLRISNNDSSLNSSDYEEEIRRLGDEVSDLMSNHLVILSSRIAENEILKVIGRYNCKKLEQQKNSLEQLNLLDKHLTDALVHTQMLYYLMLAELERVRKTTVFLTDLNSCMPNSQDHVSNRLNAMQKVIDKNKEYLKSPFHLKNPIMEFVTKLLFETETVEDFESILKKLNKLKIDSKTEFEKVFFEDCKLQINFLKTAETHINDLKKYIWCGPTQQPVIVDPQLADLLYDASVKVRDFENISKMKIDEFIKSQNLIKKDRWLKNKMSLWVWFLTEPKKVLNILEEIKTCTE